MKKTLSAAEFKAKCLSLMDEVSVQRGEIVITKRGKPVARLVPVSAERASVLGCMAGTATICGDLVAPVVSSGVWHAVE